MIIGTPGSTSWSRRWRSRRCRRASPERTSNDTTNDRQKELVILRMINKSITYLPYSTLLANSTPL